jgi:hypothetical protein
MLVDAPLPHGFGANLAVVGTLFEGFGRLVTSPPYLVGYARWDARSDQFLLARQSFQQLFSSQSALYAGSIDYPWPKTRQPRHSLHEEPRSILGSLAVTTLASICIF